MQTVSAAWRRAQRENFTPRSFVEIKYMITDPSLISRYGISSADQEWYSNLQEILGDEHREYGHFITNELGAWMLDSEIAPFSDYTNNYGYVTQSMSDTAAQFASSPKITILFEKVLLQPIPGLTITWSTGFDEFARMFTLTAYLDDEVVKTQTYINSDIECEINFDVHGYNRIDVEIDEWCLPLSRARIERLYIGFFAIFNNESIFEITGRNNADPLGSVIPENTLIFKVDNTAQLWNPANPQGLYSYLLEHQEVTARFGYEINGAVEWISGGVFFLAEWDVPQNGITATFTAKNAFEFLDETYTGPRTGTVYEIALAALHQANLYELANKAPRWVLYEGLKDYTVSVEESFQASIAQVLQLCAHAASCGLWQDRLGTIRIEPITLGIDCLISSDSIAPFGDISRLHDDTPDSTVATNEMNMWGIDEGFGIVSPTTRISFASNDLSDNSAIYANPPKLTISYRSEQRYTPAIVIAWSDAYGEMARNYNVNSYRRSELISAIEVRDNEEIHNVVPLEIPEFDYVEIEILEWCLPIRRARMEYLAPAPDYIIDQSNSKPETNINVTRELRRIIINRDLAIIDYSNIGFIQPIQNPFINNKDHALDVGNEIARWLSKRNIYYGHFRADPRLDPLDTVLVNNKFADKIVVVSKIDYSWHGGAFWGFYEGREWQ
jgi:hypothetical protein